MRSTIAPMRQMQRRGTGGRPFAFAALLLACSREPPAPPASGSPTGEPASGSPTGETASGSRKEEGEWKAQADAAAALLLRVAPPPPLVTARAPDVVARMPSEAIALGPDRVVWFGAAGPPFEVMEAPLGGGGVHVLARFNTTAHPTGPFVVDETGLFFVAPRSGSNPEWLVFHANPQTGTTSPLGSTLLPKAIAAAKSDLVVLVEGDAAADALYRLPKKGGGAPREIGKADQIQAFVVDGTSVYFTAGDALYAQPGGRPGRLLATSSNGKPRTLVDKLETAPRALAYDSTHVYFAECTSAPRIGRVAKSGGRATTAVAGRHCPSQVAVDERYVYWIDMPSEDERQEGSVLRAPKSGGDVEELEKRALPTLLAAPGKWLVYLRVNAQSSSADEIFEVVKRPRESP